jgi:osmotically-inducible protein OsmY
MDTTLKRLLGTTLVLILVGSGCGNGDPAEERLAAVGDALRQARETVQDAQTNVRTLEQVVSQSQRELDEARVAAEEAERALALVEAEVDVDATDALLFRAAQRRLLEDDALEDVAIRAEVNRGVITLYGFVPNGEIRDRAESVAGDIQGVVRVDNKIDVQVAADVEP